MYTSGKGKSPSDEELFIYGADNRTRTCTVSHRNLNPACLPIPPYPHNKRYKKYTIPIIQKQDKNKSPVYTELEW